MHETGIGICVRQVCEEMHPTWGTTSYSGYYGYIDRRMSHESRELEIRLVSPVALSLSWRANKHDDTRLHACASSWPCCQEEFRFCKRDFSLREQSFAFLLSCRTKLAHCTPSTLAEVRPLPDACCLINPSLQNIYLLRFLGLRIPTGQRFICTSFTY